MKILKWVLFFAIVISIVVAVTHYADDMWTRRCQSQYGEEAVNAPKNGQCIIEDGTIRYLR